MRRALVLVLVVGCHHANRPTREPPPGSRVENQSQSGPADDEPVLRIRQGPCMGSCPVYDATVYMSGKLEFFGGDHCVSKGLQYRDVGFVVVEEIRGQFEDARFDEIAEDGNVPKPTDCTTTNGVTTCSGSAVGCSDTSHTEITYEGKTIDDPHCVETDLSRLEDRVLPLLQLHVWIAGRD